MFVLGRSKGEKIEIASCALIRVARIEEQRVRFDIVAPFSRAVRGELSATSTPDRIATVTVLEIGTGGDARCFRAKLGICVPEGAVVRRAELVQQQHPPHRRFPWHRFRVTGRFWRNVMEELHVEIPVQQES